LDAEYSLDRLCDVEGERFLVGLSVVSRCSRCRCIRAAMETLNSVVHQAVDVSSDTIWRLCFCTDKTVPVRLNNMLIHQIKAMSLKAQTPSCDVWFGLERGICSYLRLSTVMRILPVQCLQGPRWFSERVKC